MQANPEHIEARQGVAGIRRVQICDTTLRDGEQAPGFSMDVAAKVEVAQALTRLRVDIIEAGFAASSPSDRDAIRAIASEVSGVIISSLARARVGDVDAALDALQGAAFARIHIFIGTSPLHRDAKLELSRTQILERIVRTVRHASAAGAEVQFSAEDATRTEPDFLIDVFQAAADNGATILNVPDTVGYSLPTELRELFETLTLRLRSPGVVFSAHCHNDLGLAVANSLAAVDGGATQVECTINGIGERAGNCSLEEIVMALNVRRAVTKAATRVDTTKLFETSGIVARACGHDVPPNKAVVGRNAFAHEAGIHQHGMISDSRTYEIMRAADVGQTSSLVLGRHSGKHALAAAAERLGITFDSRSLDQAFTKFKEMAASQALTDSDVEVLFEGSDQSARI